MTVDAMPATAINATAIFSSVVRFTSFLPSACCRHNRCNIIT